VAWISDLVFGIKRMVELTFGFENAVLRRGKMKNLYLFTAVLAFSVVSAQIARADISYNVNDQIGAGSVTGTLTTDGAIGVLQISDFTGWNLTFNDGVGSVAVNSINGGTGLNVEGNNLTATANQIQFNFNGTDAFFAIYSTSTCSPPEWALSSGTLYDACNGAVNNEMGVSAVGNNIDIPEQGEVTIATAGNATPEPSFWGLTALLFGGLAVIKYRKNQGKKSDQTA
jgi:hypothetical protein